MHFDIKGIIEGAVNSVFIREEIEKISKERLATCAACPFNSENKKKDGTFKTLRPDEYCTLCGCNLQMKTRSLSQICPDHPPRWGAVIKQEEEWELDHVLEMSDNKAKKSTNIK
jgi:hypothetical protein